LNVAATLQTDCHADWFLSALQLVTNALQASCGLSSRQPGMASQLLARSGLMGAGGFAGGTSTVGAGATGTGVDVSAAAGGGPLTGLSGGSVSHAASVTTAISAAQRRIIAERNTMRGSI
jgi:hypothetical protein